MKLQTLIFIHLRFKEIFLQYSYYCTLYEFMNNISCGGVHRTVGVKVFETKDQQHLKSFYDLFDDFNKVFCILMVLKEKGQKP